jgi:metal-responsive CopG/Arc/MetJ family transcriptional regulator
VAREAEDSCPVSVITVTESATTVEFNVTLPKRQVKFVDELIKKDVFQYRSQAIQEAVNLLEKQDK